MSNPIQINIYTDGGYFEQLDVGGWGTVIYKEDQELTRLSDWQKKTSSLEMELKAAVKALEAFADYLKQEALPHFQITLYTDSRIIIEGLAHKIHLWQENAWVHKSGNQVKYQSLWLSLKELSQLFKVDLKWVKGHSGNLGNTIADQLAREAVVERLQQQH